MEAVLMMLLRVGWVRTSDTLFPQTPDLPAVIQALKILFDCFNHGSLSFPLEGNVDRCSLLLLFLRFQYDISIHGQRASFADR